MSIDASKGDLNASINPQESHEAQIQLAVLQQAKWKSQLDDFKMQRKSEVGIYAFDTLSEMKIGDIRQILRDQNKRVTGNKEELISVRVILFFLFFYFWKIG